MIDMTNWRFSIGGGHPDLVSLGHTEPPVHINFPTVQDLLLCIGTDTELPDGQIDERLRAGANAMQWPKLYTRLDRAPHFRSYRGDRYDSYKAAALARTAGTATQKQLFLANGLSDEITKSLVTVPCGQLVLHGRSDRNPSAAPVYDAFLSTTISPFVARLSAIRREQQLGGRQSVYLFTLTRDLPAMWGHVGRSAEWELLFDAGLPVQETGSISAGSFDIVEAKLG